MPASAHEPSASQRPSSILTSTEPAAGAILGLLALGQRITLVQWAGIAAVVIASIGATRAHKAR